MVVNLHRLCAVLRLRIFLGAALTLSWAGRLAATELDLPVFSGGYGTAFYEETARQFEALRPGVTVRVYGGPRITDQLRVRIIDGHYPDAALPRDLLLPPLVRAGKVVDLTPYLDGPNWEGDARWRDTFLPGALDAWRVDGGIYGVPLSYACWTIFYNRGLFRAHGWTEPRTWEAFFALCEKIRSAGIAPLSLTGIYGNYPGALLRSAYYDLAGAPGWRALNELRPGAYTDPRFIRSAALLQRITQHYTLRGWEGATHTAAQLAFLDGRAAMTVSGSWMVHEMAGKFPPGFELGAMNFPVFPEGVADPTTIQAGADSFFVFATGDPERERLTVDFLRFLTSRERAEAFVRSQDAPVAVRGVPASAFSPRMRETVALIAQAHEAFNMPQVMMQPPAILQALIDARANLMTGRITPRQFGERLEAAAEADRKRAAAPDAIDDRHPFAGTLLLCALAGVGLWFAWATARGRRVGRGVPAEPRLTGRVHPTSDASAAGAAATNAPATEGGGAYFGRLRGPVALGFIGPAFLLYAALVLAPGVAAFSWAFTRWNGLGPRVWTGWFNFKWLLFESDIFWLALKNNAYLMLVPALVVLPLALLLAWLIHRGVWGASAFRAILLFPNLLGGIAATLLWLNAYEPHGGLINASLVTIGRWVGSGWLQSFDGYPWLAQQHLYVALIPIYLWMACGFNLVLYLAAMEGIDPQLYEAAEIDGAPAWRQLFVITLPLIWEVIIVSVVFLVISGLNAFEMIWLLTSQDPQSSTHTLGTLMVSSMFKEFQIGRATAIAVMLFVLVLAISALVMRGLKREEVES